MSINKLKNLDIDKVIELSIIAGILLISLSFFYYYVVFLPQKEQTRLEQEHKEYVAKRKMECYNFYKERDELRSDFIIDNYYDEKRDICVKVRAR